ncbi:MAG: hypothetical protein ACI9ND_000500, partial [Yoonia sp.]
AARFGPKYGTSLRIFLAEPLQQVFRIEAP